MITSWSTASAYERGGLLVIRKPCLSSIEPFYAAACISIAPYIINCAQFQVLALAVRHIGAAVLKVVSSFVIHAVHTATPHSPRQQRPVDAFDIRQCAIGRLSAQRIAEVSPRIGHPGTTADNQIWPNDHPNVLHLKALHAVDCASLVYTRGIYCPSTWLRAPLEAASCGFWIPRQNGSPR